MAARPVHARRIPGDGQGLVATLVGPRQHLPPRGAAVGRQPHPVVGVHGIAAVVAGEKDAIRIRGVDGKIGRSHRRQAHVARRPVGAAVKRTVHPADVGGEQEGVAIPGVDRDALHALAALAAGADAGGALLGGEQRHGAPALGPGGDQGGRDQ